MKVLWFSHRDIHHPLAGGAERTIYEISRRIVAKGDEVVWVSCSFAGAKSMTVLDGVQLYRNGNTLHAHLTAHSVIKAHAPDVIVDDLAHVVPWYSDRITTRAGTAFFRHLHSRTLPGQAPIPLAWALSQLECQYPTIYKRWPFVTESEQGVKDLVGLGVPASRTSRIPPGVDLVRFHPAEKFTEPTMVYFGGFRDYKRPWVSISVYRELRKRIPSLRLLMLGNGPNRGRVESSVPRELSSGVKFLGRVDDSALSELVARSWLNLHTSIAEGWGLSIVEAAAAGTPTVAFAVPGVAETVQSGVNGYTVKEGDADALIDSAYRILSQYGDWTARSRQFALAFGWESSAESWHQHLLRVAGRL